jgi:hypothetical protein
MSALRIKGDITKMPKPGPNLDARIDAKYRQKKACPRCGLERAYGSFLYRSWNDHHSGTPSSTPTKTCSTCRQRKPKRRRPSVQRKRA